MLIRVLTVSRLRSTDGACRKFSLMYVNMPGDGWREWEAAFRPLSSDRFWLAAWQDSTAEMLNMMEAFSKAKENWEVGFAVNASNLLIVSVGPAGRRGLYRPCKRDFYVILIHWKS